MASRGKMFSDNVVEYDSVVVYDSVVIQYMIVLLYMIVCRYNSLSGSIVWQCILVSSQSSYTKLLSVSGFTERSYTIHCVSYLAEISRG